MKLRPDTRLRGLLLVPQMAMGKPCRQAKDRSASAAKAAPTASFSRDNPLLAPLVDKRDLTHNESTKSTLHLAFSIEGTGLRYEVGDACGVIPRNDLNLVAEILQTLRFNGNEQVPCGKTGKTTLHDALTHHLQITLLNRKIVKEYATKGKCAKLLDLLVPEQQEPLQRYVYGRGLIDLLVEYPGVIEEPAELVAMLAKAHAKALFHLIEPLGSSGSDSHNRGGGSLSIATIASAAAFAPLFLRITPRSPTGSRSTSNPTRSSNCRRIPMRRSS